MIPLLVRRLFVAATVMVSLAAGPRPAAAQDNTAEMLERAVQHYDNLQVERALGVLRQIVSPSSPFEVSREQRVQAYTYIGASLALLGRRDSAIVYFRAALERDPFVDLDPRRFTAQERDAFAEARRRSFRVAVQPVRAARIQPGAGQLPFVFLTTHDAAIRVEIRPPGSGERSMLGQREGSGLHELAWNGMLPDGRLTPSGVHELWVLADSRISGERDSAQVYLTVRHDFPPLEDTLPALAASALLPERHASSAAAMELMRGLGIAAAALIAPSVLGNRELGSGGRSLSGSVAVAAGVGGVIAFIARRQNPDIPANIAENRRRIAEHSARNAEITERNRQRLAQTTLYIMPGIGAAQ